MKKLDLYIIKKFLGTFFLTLVLFIIIAIVFDITEKLEDFIDQKVSLSEIIFDYYLNFIPYFAVLFTPLFLFVAVIFFTSRMAYRSEIIAILNSGITFHRMLVPVFHFGRHHYRAEHLCEPLAHSKCEQNPHSL